MNLTESIRKLLVNIEKVESPIVEAKGHLDHPEDLVFLEGSQGANRAINACVKTVKNPKTVTIKWDGYPALIFGTGTNRKFIVVDKHMMNKTGGRGRQIFSPEQFIKYDQDRGVIRSELAELIPMLWPNLQKSYSGTGYYWGDLIFSKPLKVEKDGLYHFTANPKGIAYTVEPNSEVGELITGKQAGIAVHQYIAPDAPEKAEQMSTPKKKVVPTDLAVSLNGSLGYLKNNSDVALIPAKMSITPKLQLNQSLVANASAATKKYGSAVDKLMTTAPQAESAFQQLFTKYINKKVVLKNLNNLVKDFYTYFDNYPMTDVMRTKLTDHLNQNKEGVIGAFSIWVALYKLKMSIVTQLNKATETAPVQGYLQDGTRSQEGFVSQGLKFIDRLGFSAQNLGGRT